MSGMLWDFVFLHRITGERRTVTSHARMAALRELPEPSEWVSYECWQNGRIVWHVDDDGNIVNGPRP